MASVGQIVEGQHCATWDLVGMGGLMGFNELRSEIFCIPALDGPSMFYIKAINSAYSYNDRSIELLFCEEQRDKIVSYQIIASHCEQGTLQAQGTFKMSKTMPISKSRSPFILDYDDYQWTRLNVLTLKKEHFIRDDKARVHVKLWRGGCPEPKCYCVQTLPMPKRGLKAICN
uniref:Uncharacterized protein n=1 Tax=Lygus hesperus TaxID=30085 RepID=A0A146LDE5_LYGHE